MTTVGSFCRVRGQLFLRKTCILPKATLLHWKVTFPNRILTVQDNRNIVADFQKKVAKIHMSENTCNPTWTTVKKNSCHRHNYLTWLAPSTNKTHASLLSYHSLRFFSFLTIIIFLNKITTALFFQLLDPSKKMPTWLLCRTVTAKAPDKDNKINEKNAWRWITMKSIFSSVRSTSAAFLEFLFLTFVPTCVRLLWLLTRVCA